MISFPDGICPLCSQVHARELLQEHIVLEDPRLREAIIKLIQAYYPGWIQDHGACAPCWRSYRDASRAIYVMKSARPQNAVG